MQTVVKVLIQKASVYQSVTRQNAVILPPILFAVYGVPHCSNPILHVQLHFNKILNKLIMIHFDLWHVISRLIPVNTIYKLSSSAARKWREDGVATFCLKQCHFFQVVYSILLTDQFSVRRDSWFSMSNSFPLYSRVRKSAGRRHILIASCMAIVCKVFGPLFKTITPWARGQRWPSGAWNLLFIDV